jgi:serine/threonine-protein kinase
MAASARFCGSCGAAISLPGGPSTGPATLTPGTEVAGRYRVLAKLGEGGMGAVYRAEQISLKRKVALKILRPELSTDAGLIHRFNAEAELAARLSHPNTVTLFDFGQDDDGSLFIAMEFIEGTSLRDAVMRGPLEPPRIVRICEQICSSLADAHSHGIVHRDLKPDNVMLSQRGRERDVARVLDFGIAKLRDEQGNVSMMPQTRAGDLLGTPQYMAPEQIRGEKVDARTDIYALGAMLFEMMTGQLPFDGATVMALLSKHLTEMPRDPRQVRPDLPLPDPLVQLCLRMLAKNPAARPASMDEVLHTLEAYERNQYPTPATTMAPQGEVPSDAPAAQPTPVPPAAQPNTSHPAVPNASAAPLTHKPAPRHSSTRGWALALVGVVLVGGGGVAAYLTLRPGEKSETSKSSEAEELERWANAPNQAELMDEIKKLEELSEEVGERLGSEPQAAGELDYRDALHGFRLRLPAGFQGTGDGEGTASFHGTVDGHFVRVFVTSWNDPSVRDDAGMLAALDMRLASLGLSASSLDETRIGGRRCAVGEGQTIDGSERGSYMFTRSGTVLYFASVGGAADDHPATRAFQREVLRERLSIP